MMRLLSFVLTVLLVIPSSAFAQSIAIDTPSGNEEVAVPFVVEGVADPGAVLVLEADGAFVTVFRADADGRFSVPVSQEASRITVSSKTDPANSSTVSLVTGGEFERRVTPGETDIAVTAPDVPPPPEELEGDAEDAPEEPASTENPRTTANDLPPGYIEKCHHRPIGSALHCHVVPHDSMPTFQPFGVGVMVAQFFGSLVGAAALAVGGGGLTYAAARPSGDELGAQAAGLTVGILLLLPGAALGTWGTGALFGGKGNFLWTLGGTVLAGSIGSVLGYHLSADHVYEDELRQYKKFGHQYGSTSTRGLPLVVLRF
jgi:hypothetical protein